MHRAATAALLVEMEEVAEHLVPAMIAAAAAAVLWAGVWSVPGLGMTMVDECAAGEGLSLCAHPAQLGVWTSALQVGVL